MTTRETFVPELFDMMFIMLCHSSCVCDCVFLLNPWYARCFILVRTYEFMFDQKEQNQQYITNQA
jgi:hypothetical protein